MWFHISCWSVNPSRRSHGCGPEHLLTVEAPLYAALFYGNDRSARLPPPTPAFRAQHLERDQAHPSLQTISHCGGVCLGMFWKTGVLIVGCALLPFCLLGAESSGRWGKSVTFHRTRGKRRPERETSSSSNTGNSSQGHAFTSCRIPLTTAEHEVLDDNTHEVRWVWLTLLMSNPTIWGWAI